MEIVIREIETSDYHDVMVLRNDVLGSNMTEDNFTSKMELMNKNDGYKTFVAVLNNNVAGFISIITILAMEWEIGYLRVDGLAVKEEYQNKGIGSKLLAYAENYAKEIGLSCSSLNSNFKRTDAHSFYESKSYTKHAYYFVKRL